MSRVGAAVRREVHARAKACCEYCCAQEAFCPESLSVEHIVPRAAGGSDSLDNLALSCQGCNNRKYDARVARDPVSGRLVDLFHPRTMSWDHHFRWSEDMSAIVGATDIGRATVSRLQMNREGLVRMRRVLVSAGLHPPPRQAGGG